MNIKYLTGALFAAVLTGIYLFLTGLLSISSDETSRSLISYYWFKSGVIETTSWLPLHFFINGLGFHLLDDLIILPRLISLVFGLLTITATAFLTSELFKEKEIIIYSLIIILFIPQRIILTAVPLPEIIFFFFVITGALFFLKWLKLKRDYYLLISALFIALSGTLRYEGWIIAASLGVYTILELKKVTVQIKLLLILSAFPLFWFVFNYLKFGNFLYFLLEPENNYLLAQEKNLLNTMIFNPFTQFIEQNLITLNALGIIGLFLLRKNKIYLKWFTVFFIPLVIFSLLALTGKPLPAHNFWRTSAVWVILLIPFTAFMLFRIRKLIEGFPFGFILLILFFFQLVNANNYYIKNIKREYCLTRQEINAAGEIIRFVKNYGDYEERILIENIDSFEHLDITLASQDPFRFILSKRKSIVPYEEKEYADAKIGFYLVKSQELKKLLSSRKYYSRGLEINGWTLFCKKSLKVKKHIEMNNQLSYKRIF